MRYRRRMIMAILGFGILVYIQSFNRLMTTYRRSINAQRKNREYDPVMPNMELRQLKIPKPISEEDNQTNDVTTTTPSETVTTKSQFHPTSRSIHTIRKTPKPTKVLITTKNSTVPTTTKHDTKKKEPEVQTTPKDVAKSQGLVPITWSDPKIYSGPVVEGWAPQVSRNLSDYINANTCHVIVDAPKAINLKNTSIFIVVHSDPKEAHVREMIRETWWKFGRNWTDVSMIFFFGVKKMNSLEQEKNLQRDIQLESRMFGDIVQVNFTDHYNNLTIKTMLTLRYILSLPWTRTPKYLFKIDSDSFINIHSLRRLLIPFKPKLFLGRLITAPKNKPPKPLKIKAKDKKLKFAPKWTCPTYMFNGKEYPYILSGSGYVAEFSLISCLFNEGMKIPFFHLEDVFLTGFVRQRCNLTITHTPWFYTDGYNSGDMNSSTVLMHYQRPRHMVAMIKIAFFEKVWREFELFRKILNVSRKGMPDWGPMLTMSDFDMGIV